VNAVVNAYTKDLIFKRVLAAINRSYIERIWKALKKLDT
jgi:hypothetical protein